MTYSYNRPGSNARRSLFLNLRFIRYGKINPGDFRMYERYVHWRVGRRATAMKMQKKGVSCPTANSQGGCAVMNGLPLKCLDKHAPRSCKEGTNQNPMCFYRFLRILGLSRWTKLLIRKATWERRKEEFPEIRDGPAAIWSVQAINLES